MQPRQNIYTQPDPAGFSSVLRQATVTAKPAAGNQMGNTDLEQPFVEYDPYNNRNLSSVISRITDDGPASQLKSTGNNQKRKAYGHRTDSSGRMQDDVYTPSLPKNDNDQQQVLPQSFTFDESTSCNEEESVRHLKGAGWQQLTLLLIFVVITAMGYLLYKLSLQTDALGTTIHSSEWQMQLTANSRPQVAEAIPGITGLGTALTELKQELRDIKAGQKATNSRLDLNKIKKLKPQLLQAALTGDEVTALRNDFEHIQHQMHEKNQIDTRVSDDDMLLERKVTVDQDINQESKQGLPEHFVVTLASLTNRDKALAASEILQRSGALPLIEEVVVNEDRVYRISVDGFESRASATAFIAKANERYGFEGGWIRKQ
ncbi:MAG: SPOR domain-containing protein [Gammaproteobacteria bacterium]|nr:SPOR domain-containing protein [Gammaproteobacteria bacterium]